MVPPLEVRHGGGTNRPEEDAVADVTSIVDTYLAMWNEEDDGRRHELVATSWREDGRYVDPLQEAEGHAAIDAMVVALQGQMPGHRFTRTSAVDVHHDELRFGWQLAAPDGAVAVAGVDVGSVAADGRLQRITGFFGPLPEEADAGEP
jgi:hypothetical protein